MTCWWLVWDLVSHSISLRAQYTHTHTHTHKYNNYRSNTIQKQSVCFLYARHTGHKMEKQLQA